MLLGGCVAAILYRRRAKAGSHGKSGRLLGRKAAVGKEGALQRSAMAGGGQGGRGGKALVWKENPLKKRRGP